MVVPEKSYHTDSLQPVIALAHRKNDRVVRLVSRPRWGGFMIYVLKNEPSPSAFCDILDFGVGKCGFAILVIQPLNRMSPDGVAVLKTLEPYLAEKKVTNKWPGHKMSAGNALVHKYKYEEPFARAIQDINDHLYGWLQPNFPEDICL